MTFRWVSQFFNVFRRRPLKEDREEFRRILDREFTPLLKERGFSGRRPNWRRVRDPFIDCVNLQHSKWHDKCCVNLGLHLTFVPVLATGELPDADKLTVVECAFDDRLNRRDRWPQIWETWWGPDKWWSYRNPQKNAQELIDYFSTHAEGFFKRFSDFPTPFIDVSLEKADLYPQRFSPGRLFVLAHVHLHLRQGDLAKRFAAMGIERLGNLAVVNRMVKEFQRVGDAAEKLT